MPRKVIRLFVPTTQSDDPDAQLIKTCVSRLEEALGHYAISELKELPVRANDSIGNYERAFISIILLRPNTDYIEGTEPWVPSDLGRKFYVPTLEYDRPLHATFCDIEGGDLSMMFSRPNDALIPGGLLYQSFCRIIVDCNAYVQQLNSEC